MRRRRRKIRVIEQLAATLSMLLPQEMRDQLRAARVPAQTVRALFDIDHNELHALGGKDRWWNLTPMLRQEHRDKSRLDTAIVAKVKRIRTKVGLDPAKRKRPHRVLRSRGFDKRWTRHFDGTVTPRDR